MTINSMNVHDIVQIDICSECLDADGRPFTVKKYTFTDADGNAFTVNAFLSSKMIFENLALTSATQTRLGEMLKNGEE